MSLQKDSQFPLTNLLTVSSITTIIIALLYTAGWSYVYHYFSRFHLGLLGLEIKREFFLLYGFWVIKERLLYVLACLSCTIVLYFLSRLLWQRSAINESSGSVQELTTNTSVRETKISLMLHILSFIGTPVYLLILFMISYQLGTWAGWDAFDREIKNDFPSYPRVKVWLTVNEDTDNNTRQRSEEWAKGCYRLLMRNKDNLYIFHADDMSNKTPTEIIPQKKVEAIRVLPLYQSSVECLE